MDHRISIPAAGYVRYRDATIGGGRLEPDAHDASDPRLVLEGLSRSTGWYDQTRKSRDGETAASIRQDVCISQSEPRIRDWLRDGEQRFQVPNDVLEGAVDLAQGEAMPMLRRRDIDESLSFAGSAS